MFSEIFIPFPLTSAFWYPAFKQAGMGKSQNILGDCLIGIFVKVGVWIQNKRKTKQAKLATLTLFALQCHIH